MNADADADSDVYYITNADADVDADVQFITTADADADADVKEYADVPRMRMRMRISDTSLAPSRPSPSLAVTANHAP